MRIGGRLVGSGARFVGVRVGRLEDAARRRLQERLRNRLAARPRASATGGAGDGARPRIGRRRLSLTERLRVIEETER